MFLSAATLLASTLAVVLQPTLLDHHLHLLTASLSLPFLLLWSRQLHLTISISLLNSQHHLSFFSLLMLLSLLSELVANVES